MIRKITIKNFKSIVDLTLDLGRFNVVIGANGCGKTNILEALVLASGANSKVMRNEFLMVRGVRIAKPELMINAFEEGSYSRGDDDLSKVMNKCISVAISENDGIEKEIMLGFDDEANGWRNMSLLNNPRNLEIVRDIASLGQGDEISSVSSYVKSHYPDDYERFMELINPSKSSMDSFLIYHPKEDHLKEVKESLIAPFGIQGDGLLQYLKEKSQQPEYKELFESINEGLGMLDWFDGVAVPGNLLSNEYKLSIGDKYLRDSMHFFDQRSTNEGFMFLLFYLTLFNSKDTPPFFSIDNIETALNPRLCTELTSRLIKISKEKDKQVVVTTHSPFVLDALDLSDDEVRLFVARRDIDGHTRLERIMYREDRNMPLSELWMSGLIGGLPDNF